MKKIVFGFTPCIDSLYSIRCLRSAVAIKGVTSNYYLYSKSISSMLYFIITKILIYSLW